MSEIPRPRRNTAPSAKQREIGASIIDGSISHRLDDPELHQMLKKLNVLLLLLRDSQEYPEMLPAKFRIGGHPLRGR